MCVKPPFSPWWRYWMRCASTWVSDSSRTLSEAQTFSMNVVDSVLEEIVVDGHHGVLLPVWISPSFSCLTPVQRVYREVSEGELRVRKSGKLPLALPQCRDFPLLRPRVSVWFFPKQNTEPPNSSLHFPPTASHIFPYSKTKWLDWSWVFSTMFCCLPHDTEFVLLT